MVVYFANNNDKITYNVCVLDVQVILLVYIVGVGAYGVVCNVGVANSRVAQLT